MGITVPPLGLAYLAAMLEKEGHEVDIIDAQALKLSISQIKKEIEERQPDLLGVTSVTPTIYEALELIKITKSVSPYTFTVLGGPHVSFLPIKTLEECPQLDAVCIGEGEETVVDLAKTVECGGNLSNVRGIAYRSEGGIVKNPPRPLISDLDSLPFPARHLLPMNKYTILGKKSVIGHLMTSRGCPFNCIFCSSSLLFGKKFRGRSPENVVDEMEHVISEYKARTIEFADDEFTLNRKRVEGICYEIRKRGLDVFWACSSRVDTISKDLLKKMKRAGCFLIYYGIESGSQRILNFIRKGITIDKVIRAIKWTKEVGIKTLGSFIIGFPGETEEDIKKTISLAKKLRLDYAQFAIATPYPGTELYDLAKREGMLETEDWSQYTAANPVLKNYGCSRETLIKLFKEAYTTFYLSPRMLLKNLSYSNLQIFLKAVRSAIHSLIHKL